MFYEPLSAAVGEEVESRVKQRRYRVSRRRKNYRNTARRLFKRTCAIILLGNDTHDQKERALLTGRRRRDSGGTPLVLRVLTGRVRDSAPLSRTAF